jgi:hemerythrin-like metal-binding protein
MESHLAKGESMERVHKANVWIIVCCVLAMSATTIMSYGTSAKTFRGCAVLWATLIIVVPIVYFTKLSDFVKALVIVLCPSYAVLLYSAVCGGNSIAFMANYITLGMAVRYFDKKIIKYYAMPFLGVCIVSIFFYRDIIDPFTFTDKFKTGISLVDDEHRHLFEIIKQTNDLIHEDLLHDKYDRIMQLLAELKDYTEFHFKDEEDLMTRIGYPEIEAQKRAHSAFIERLVEINVDGLDEIDNNQQAYLLDLVDFLVSWLSNHIIAADKKIGIFMAENNIK